MDGTNKVILIVEDDTGLQELISEIAGDCGYGSAVAGSAAEALQWLGNQQPCFMILDYRLPDMNGGETIAEITKSGIPLPPFIVSTGNGDERIAVEMMKLGARDYIVKDANFLGILPFVIERVGRDIENEASRRRAECSLNDLNMFNRQIIENAQEGIIVYDHDLRYKIWNPFMEKLTGIPASGILGKFPWEVFGFLKNTGLVDNLYRVLRGESLGEYDFEFYVESTGKSGWVSNSSAALYNSSGEIIGVIDIIRDVTTRKMAELSLKQAEESQRAMIENISDVISIIDTNGIIRYKSANIKQWFGWNPEELVGKNGFENIHEADRSYAAASFVYLLEIPDATRNLELRYRCRDGAYKWIKLTATNKVNNPSIGGILVNYHDITESRQMKESLAEKEKLLRFYIENAPMAILEFDSGFRITRYTGFSEKIFGWTAEEALGKTIGDLSLISDEDNPITPEMLGQLVSGSAPQVIVSGINRRKDGSLIHCEWYNTVLKDHEGKILSILSQVLDITERKNAEKILIESEEKYRNLFENMSEAFALHQIILDETGKPADYRFLEVNPEFARRVGIPQQDIVNRTVLELFPKTEKIWIEKFGEVALNGASIRYSDFAGALNRHYETYVYSPRPGCFAGLFTDVTEKLEQENEIRRLSKAVECLQVSIVITDTGGNIVFANPYFSSLTGYSRDEYMGNNPRMLKSGYHSNEFYNELWNTVLAGKTWEGEIHNKKKNGEFYWEYSFITPILDKAGEIVNFVAVKTDITEHKKINDALVLAKEKAEESDRLKTAFLQNISHELRTPMNAIVGFSELIADSVMENGKLRDYSEIIKLRCNDLLNIVNGILDIAKIEAGQVTVTTETINLELVFQDLYLYYSAQKKRMKKDHLEFQINPQFGPDGSWIITDVVKLRQILVNLLDNAFKFTPCGRVETGCYTNENGNLVFYVSDTGIGISPDKQSIIFERFTQLNADARQLYGGTGLGLSIVRGLIQTLGGNIWLSSEPGAGSTFCFTLPYEIYQGGDDTTEQHHPEPQDENVYQCKSVLIVEDDRYNAEFLSELLSETGLRLVHASYGKEAIDLARSTNFDIVLMDINLPDISGYEAISQILEHKPGQKIIAQTAYAAGEDEKKALKTGCVAFLSKPVNQKVLFALLEKYLR